jgi:hypothetical protein
MHQMFQNIRSWLCTPISQLASIGEPRTIRLSPLTLKAMNLKGPKGPELKLDFALPGTCGKAHFVRYKVAW